MNIVRMLSAAAVFALGVTPLAAAEPPRAQVMIVGVAHLMSRHDVYNAVFTDDPRSPKRQVQVHEIVARLARFHPTKVLIEAPFGDPKYNEQYRRFLAGRFALGANEIYQYGFNLAARSGDPSIYPVDTPGRELYESDSPSGKRIDSYLMAHFKSVVDAKDTAEEARDRDLEIHGTYLDLLRHLNTDEAITANASWYSVFDGMGREADDAGAVYVAQWYTRNCEIFSNILSVVRPGDRVVLFMGQGHEYLLREFVRLNPNLRYVNPLPYLDGAPKTAGLGSP